MMLVPRDSLVGLVIGPTVWTGYFVSAYLIAGLGCNLGWERTELAGMNAIQLLVLVTGGAAAVIILLAGVQAYRGRHRASRSIEGDPADRRRRMFLYNTALLLCALFFVGTIWVAAGSLIQPVC